MLSEDQITEIYRNSSRELYIYIYRLTSSPESSEDILHDCFVNLIKYSQKHEINTDWIRAFLYKTAHNLAVNHLKRTAKIEFSAIETSGELPAEDKASSELELKELNEKIYKALNYLDADTRSIFIMKKELGLTISEIAINTGKSERTVIRKIQRTMEFLSGELKKSGFGFFIILIMALFFYLIVT